MALTAEVLISFLFLLLIGNKSVKLLVLMFVNSMAQYLPNLFTLG